MPYTLNQHNKASRVPVNDHLSSNLATYAEIKLVIIVIINPQLAADFGRKNTPVV